MGDTTDADDAIRTGQRPGRSTWLAATAVALVAVVGVGIGVGVDRSRDGHVVESSSPTDEALTFDELIARLDCEEFDISETSYVPVVPIRGRAATRGFTCVVDGTNVHVFERAPTPDELHLDEAQPDDDATHLSGGSLENIDRLLGTGTVTPGCDIVRTVTTHYFVVSPSQAALDTLAAFTESSIVPVRQASPTVSYLGLDCTLD